MSTEAGELTASVPLAGTTTGSAGGFAAAREAGAIDGAGTTCCATGALGGSMTGEGAGSGIEEGGTANATCSVGTAGGGGGVNVTGLTASTGLETLEMPETRCV